jgi:hypothetical protein
MQRRVGSQHVVVDLDVLVAEALDLPHVGPDGVRVRGKFGLGIDNANLHRSGSTLHGSRHARISLWTVLWPVTWQCRNQE